MGTTSIRIKPELAAPLEELAAEIQRSKNWLINEAIREYLEKNRIEAKRWEDTLMALNSIKEGREIPSQDVEKWLESWGSEHELKPPQP
ncbi:ribbon-helix-helix protein, CopG family [bacterium]|nr:ribbon-helix-helix protein, CopG family [bacterium]